MKCTCCGCSRDELDFCRRERKWKTCNSCSKQRKRKDYSSMIKCSKCRCWRESSDFFRRFKVWKTCNQCCK